MKHSVLQNFSVVLPPNELPQQKLLNWAAKNHDYASGGSKLPLEKLFLRYGVSEEKISRRFFECNDIVKERAEEYEIYKVSPEKPNGADIYARNQFFSQRAQSVFEKFYSTTPKKPDHLIHVTCTGYISPSAAQILVAKPEWKKQTQITHAYHMGCYASLPAIRMADAFAKAEDNTSIDIVHTEMCGLHMNPIDHSPEQMVVQSLFADGHIKYTVTSENGSRGLKILKTRELVISESKEDMSWTPAAWGMQMNLSREVPEKIQKHILPFLQDMLASTAFKTEDILRNAIFAVHPGGPKIIDSVQQTLEVSDAQIALSKKVLYERGNMSSATLPHIWKEILDSDAKTGTKVISFAFGPGLTVFGAIFEIV